MKTLEKPPVRELLVLSFIEGASVMGVELISAKMIAPFFGTSLYIWSAVLAITLLALTAGYYAGGVYSEKSPNLRKLLFLISLATFFIFIMPFLSHKIMEMTLDMGFKTGTIISCMIFLFPPLFLFGMVSPYIS